MIPTSLTDSLPTLPFLDAARDGLQASLIGLTAGPGARPIDYLNPPGDAGLYGPDSVVWRVHADFPAMLAGGISALMLQALHPLAMAGVYDHSAFREDPFGRLRRTATFVAGTTFGPTKIAGELIATVKRVHKKVVGKAPDGRDYAASDPELLTWVHIAEVASFLKSYRRYAGRISTDDQDRYFAETAIVAERLGARDVPKTAHDVRAYFRRVEPDLVYGAQAKEAIDFLFASAAPHPAMQPGARLFLEAAVDLLPSFAKRLTGVWRLPMVDPLVVRPAFHATAALMRWSLRNTAAHQAARRIKLSPSAR